MAVFNKFNSFVEHLAEGVHNLGANTLKVMITNTAPTAANSVKTDLTEITAGNGYTAGGATVTITSSAQTAGVYSLVGTDVVFTAAGGTIGPLRYVAFYNDTPTSPADPLIGWWEYPTGSITLQDTESLTVDFAATILTLQ